MGIDHSLTPELVQQLITSEEVPFRRLDFPEETVLQILRYGAYVGHRIALFSQIDRGMDYGRQLLQDHESEGKSFPSGFTIVAERLRCGKGRFRREWHAPAGGVWMTVIIANTLLPESARLFPLAAGIACCETVNAYVPEARLKWINDVHVQGRKICGVLTETVRGKELGEEFIMIGMGVNVNNQGFPAELQPIATSIRQQLNREIELTEFAGKLLAKLIWNIGLLHHEEESFLRESLDTEDVSGAHSLLMDRWRQLSDTVGRKVLFGYDVQQNPQFEAEVLGVDDGGGLKLKNLQDNSVTVECSGEILYLD